MEESINHHQIYDSEGMDFVLDENISVENSDNENTISDAKKPRTEEIKRSNKDHGTNELSEAEFKSTNDVANLYHIKKYWTQADDNSLKAIMNDNNFTSWKDVAKLMGTRSAKQCRERWSEYLDPDLLVEAFTAEEDEIILREQATHGNKWKLINNTLGARRTTSAIKVRWKTLTKVKKPKKISEQHQETVARPSPSRSGLNSLYTNPECNNNLGSTNSSDTSHLITDNICDQSIASSSSKGLPILSSYLSSPSTLKGSMSTNTLASSSSSSSSIISCKNSVKSTINKSSSAIIDDIIENNIRNPSTTDRIFMSHIPIPGSTSYHSNLYSNRNCQDIESKNTNSMSLNNNNLNLQKKSMPFSSDIIYSPSDLWHPNEGLENMKGTDPSVVENLVAQHLTDIQEWAILTEIDEGRGNDPPYHRTTMHENSSSSQSTIN